MLFFEKLALLKPYLNLAMNRNRIAYSVVSPLKQFLKLKIDVIFMYDVILEQKYSYLDYFSQKWAIFANLTLLKPILHLAINRNSIYFSMAIPLKQFSKFKNDAILTCDVNLVQQVVILAIFL